MSYHVYLIETPQGRRYIGLSEDVEQRLQDHNSGVSTWTRRRGPWKLKWISHKQSDLSSARKLENLLKRQKGGLGLQPLLETNGEFIDSRS